MKSTVLAASLITIIGIGGIGIYKYSSEILGELRQSQSSDSRASSRIRIGGDGYLGYFFATSPEMKRSISRRGIELNFTNDGGTYAERLDKFAKGEYDAMMLPVNSYLEHGAKYKYPGVIVASIAESKGADAIVAFADKVKNGKVADLNDSKLRIVYTKESPSSFLLDLTMVDFDLFNLAQSRSWRREVNGSAEAFDLAKRRQGDVFVMWEPEVSKALRECPGMKKIWGSEAFSGYIVDVFVFRREFVDSHKKELLAFLESYFSSLRSYSNDHQKLVEDMKKTTGLKSEEIEPMLKQIDWHDLQENTQRQFGLSSGAPAGAPTSEGVVNSIISCTNVLVRTKKFERDPLSDPYKIINSSFLTELTARVPAEVGAPRKQAFAQLTNEQWSSLRELGTMRVEAISFQQGSNLLSKSGEAQVDRFADLLKNNYPDTRVIIRGHTASGSDEAACTRLSEERAAAVEQRLNVVHGLSRNRLHSEGNGSRHPPEHRPGENQRAYLYRVPRVEFSLYYDNNL